MANYSVEVSTAMGLWILTSVVTPEKSVYSISKPQEQSGVDEEVVFITQGKKPRTDIFHSKHSSEGHVKESWKKVGVLKEGEPVFVAEEYIDDDDPFPATERFSEDGEPLQVYPSVSRVIFGSSRLS